MLSPEKTALKLVNEMVQQQPGGVTNGVKFILADKTEIRERAKECAKIAISYIYQAVQDDESKQVYWTKVFNAIDKN